MQFVLRRSFYWYAIYIEEKLLLVCNLYLGEAFTGVQFVLRRSFYWCAICIKEKLLLVCDLY